MNISRRNRNVVLGLVLLLTSLFTAPSGIRASAVIDPVTALTLAQAIVGFMKDVYTAHQQNAAKKKPKGETDTQTTPDSDAKKSLKGYADRATSIGNLLELSVPAITSLSAARQIVGKDSKKTLTSNETRQINNGWWPDVDSALKKISDSKPYSSIFATDPTKRNVEELKNAYTTLDVKINRTLQYSSTQINISAPQIDGQDLIDLRDNMKELAALFDKLLTDSAFELQDTGANLDAIVTSPTSPADTKNKKNQNLASAFQNPSALTQPQPGRLDMGRFQAPADTRKVPQ